MARNLYRFYLYAVFVAMLVFATVGLVIFLQMLFELTGLRGTFSNMPTSAAIVQASVFFGVSLFIAALVGGVHYWLIRRDMRSDPATGGSNAIRSFFLNVTELITAPIAIALGASAISQLGQLSTGSDPSSAMAGSIGMLALVGVLEWERRRAVAGTSAGLFFQRLNLYGVQFILLNVLIAYATFALNVLVDAIFFNSATYSNYYCSGPGACQGPNVLSNLAAALWVALFWIAVGFAGRKDATSLLQRVAYYIGFAYGAGFVLFGVGQAIALGILNFSGTNVAPHDVVQTYNFTASLITGLSIVAVYTLWIRSSTRQQSIPSTAWQTALSIAEAILAGLMALAFYSGAALVLLNILESPVSTTTWANALASLITGVGYIALDIHIYRRRERNIPGANDARRAFAFALLGGGVLATAIGGAFALYAVISAALGSPLDNWQHQARAGASAAAVGLVILVVYFVLANREKLFVRSARGVVKVESPVAPAPVVEMTEPALADAQTSPVPVATMAHLGIEAVLDELLTGKLSRDEAATRIREITGVK